MTKLEQQKIRRLPRQGKAKITIVGKLQEMFEIRYLPNFGTAVLGVKIDVPTKDGKGIFFDVEIYGHDAERIYHQTGIGAWLVIGAYGVRRTWQDRQTYKMKAKIYWKAEFVTELREDGNGLSDVRPEHLDMEGGQDDETDDDIG
jgi:single-stranded DNA-binding protein